MENIIERYIPKSLSRADLKKQKKNILKSRKLYKKGVFYQRPKVKSYKSKNKNSARRERYLLNYKNK